MPRKHPNGSVVLRVDQLEAGQRETNRRLGRIERLFELSHKRLENLESGQREVVVGVKALIDASRKIPQRLDAVVERLDRLVEGSVREKTEWIDRLVRLEHRLDKLEARPTSR